MDRGSGRKAWEERGPAREAQAFAWSHWDGVPTGLYSDVDPQAIKRCFCGLGDPDDVEASLGRVESFLDAARAPEDKAFLESVQEILGYVLAGHAMRRDIFGTSVPELPARTFVQLDLAELFKDFPEIEHFWHRLIFFIKDVTWPGASMSFTAGRHMMLTNLSWGSGDPTAECVLGFLAKLSTTLVESLQISFTLDHSGVDYEPLFKVLRTWESLEKVSLWSSQSLDIDPAAKEMVVRLRPRKLRLGGYVGSEPFEQLVECEGLKEFDLQYPPGFMNFPVHDIKRLFKVLPASVNKVSLDVKYTYQQYSSDFVKSLSVLPRTVRRLETRNIRFLTDVDAIKRVFGGDQFEEVAFFQMGVPTDNTLDCYSLQFLFETVSTNRTLRVLETDNMSQFAATIVKASPTLKKFVLYDRFASVPNKVNLDMLRAFAAFQTWAGSEFRYLGPPAATYSVAEFAKMANHVRRNAETRAAVLLFCYSELAPTAHERETI